MIATAQDVAWYNDTKKELESYYPQIFDRGANVIAKSITDIDLVDVVVESLSTADVNGMNAQALVSVVETYSRSFSEPGLIKAKLVTTSVAATNNDDVFKVFPPEQMTVAMSNAQNMNLAVIFLKW